MEHKPRLELTLVGAVYLAKVARPQGGAAGGTDCGTAALAIETPDGPVPAEVAVSCLVRPEPDDEVSVLVDDAGRAIVQAVLRRPGGGPLTVTATDGLTLQAGDTSLHLDSRHGAFLASDRMVGIAAATLDLRAAEASADLGRMIWRAVSVHGLADRLMTAAESLVTQAGMLVTRAKVSLRTAETLDKTDAPVVELRGQKMVSIYGETTHLNAAEDVRINGTRVNIG